MRFSYWRARAAEAKPPTNSPTAVYSLYGYLYAAAKVCS